MAGFWILLWVGLGGIPGEAEPLAVGETREARIESSDPVASSPALERLYLDAPVRFDPFELRVDEAGPIRVELRAPYFDAYLIVRGEDGGVLGEDDDGLVGTDAQVVFERLEPGRYRVEACALHGGLGPYRIAALSGVSEPLSPVERLLAEVADAKARLEAVEETHGPESLEVAEALDRLGRALWKVGRFSEARPLFERALALRERLLDPDDPRIAESVNNLSAVLFSEGRYREAEPLMRKAVAVREKALGPEHPFTGRVLLNLGWTLVELGRYREASEPLERALAIQRKAYGPGSLETARPLSHLGVVAQRLGELERARALLEEAYAIVTREGNPLRPEDANIPNNLAEVLVAQGELDHAEELLEAALVCIESNLGPGRPEALIARLNRAGVDRRQGRHLSALDEIDKLAKMFEERLGSFHPLIFQLLSHRAVVLVESGRTREARVLLERLIASVPAGHPADSVAGLHNNMGCALLETGDFGRAIEGFERSLTIREGMLGPDHPSLVVDLMNCALAHLMLGDITAAEPLLLRARRIATASFGAEHMETAKVSRSLARLEAARGNWTEALRLAASAKETLARALGAEHPETALAAEIEAMSLFHQGKTEEALETQRQVVSHLERCLGNDHFRAIVARSNLAEILDGSGRVSEAVAIVFENLESQRRYLARLFPILSESERLALAAEHRFEVELLLLLTERDPAAADPARVYAEVLAWKGIVSQGLYEDRQWIHESGDADTARLLQNLHGVLAELSPPSYQRASDWGSSEKRLAELLRLKEERDRLEREIAKRVPERRDFESPTDRLDRLRGALSGEQALVDFVVRAGREDEGPRLTAFVARVDAPILRIELGSARAVDLLVRFHRENLDDPGTQLRDRLWKPLEPGLRDTSRIFVCPDEGIALLPFETLPGSSPGTFLIEEKRWVYLQSASEILDLEEEPPVFGRGILLAGGLDYDRAADLAATEEGPPRPPSLDDAVAAAVPFSDRSSELREFRERFEPLPRSRHEIDAIARLYRERAGEKARRGGDEGELAGDGTTGGITILDGNAAVEASVKKAVRGRRYVHLATHGYFIPDSAPRAGAIASVTPRVVPGGPLRGLRAGIALSGANLPFGAGGENGLLTEGEAAWLDLSGCELVTLSACDTGLGSPARGEHLLGLRRALRLAGARARVTSLWKVNDEAAERLMLGFYRRLWLEGRTKQEALRGAQLEMLRENRARFGRARPDTWGAFVLEGDWR